jgi:uncharacterized protein (UPF0303 family)
MDSLAQMAGQTIKEIAADTGLTENAIEVVLRNRKLFYVSGKGTSSKTGGRGAYEYSLVSDRDAEVI